MFETLIGWIEGLNAIKWVFTETQIGAFVLAAFAIPAIIKHHEQIVDYFN
ncbi:hypothetical protein [Brevibacillus porteri]|nr:hypothetical protein [Brevibacillus porteri]MED1801796.1 hypothetical protein [Brevibacillus porteri]MED2134927.1 hypothetical protein [Brevibacillus porteri]MED2748434.1 hypothetical protein [Brevibacillus porteri]MED2818358.1 hypothetical protein [Brevibacillus porteri]MED2897683.1 hypothetical protein [Brevibacillus porteri]